METLTLKAEAAAAAAAAAATGAQVSSEERAVCGDCGDMVVSVGPCGPNTVEAPANAGTCMCVCMCVWLSKRRAHQIDTLQIDTSEIQG